MTTSTSVLLLSGDGDSAEMYAVGLSLAGFQPQVAADASHMRSCLASGPPQAIVADFIAGWDPGWELLRELRGRADTCDTPVVLIVSSLTASIRARAEELGYAALLTKPCLPDALAGALRSALQSDSSSDNQCRHGYVTGHP
jgi:DNA-binding response OmpR family regulator